MTVKINHLHAGLGPVLGSKLESHLQLTALCLLMPGDK
jgi:hypothetical protein